LYARAGAAKLLTETRLTAATIAKIDSVVVFMYVHLRKPQTSFYEVGIIARESGCAKTILINIPIVIHGHISALNLLKNALYLISS
jgi:hypothetical protein